MTRLALILALSASAGSARADTFGLPDSCTAYLTVQMRSCTLSHHFTCASDPAGFQRRVDLDEEGMNFMGTIDAETQWIESFHVLAGLSEFLRPDPVDPASFTALLTTGHDTYDFETESPELGRFRYVGEDRLTGKAVTIDDVTLDETLFQIRAYDGNGDEMWRSAGHEYINRDWRIFLPGTGTIITPDDTFDTDDTPVEFIFPGEPGFLSTNPKYGCGSTLSNAPAQSD